MTKISKEIPAIYETLKTKFGVNWKNGIIITYGDTIYCKYKLSFGKLAHEKTHIKQQLAYGVDKWWADYLEDPQFRLNQEIEAYQNEIKFINANEHNYIRRKQLINQINADLSSYIYGNIVTLDGAKVVLTGK